MHDDEMTDDDVSQDDIPEIIRDENALPCCDYVPRCAYTATGKTPSGRSDPVYRAIRIGSLKYGPSRIHFIDVSDPSHLHRRAIKAVVWFDLAHCISTSLESEPLTRFTVDTRETRFSSGDRRTRLASNFR